MGQLKTSDNKQKEKLHCIVIMWQSMFYLGGSYSLKTFEDWKFKNNLYV